MRERYARRVERRGIPVEEIEDALLEGNRPYQPGTARAALAHHDFRVLYFGAFASNIGTWMQNVVLAALVREVTHSPVWVGIIIFAQLGPLLIVTPLGGLLADALDRRTLLIWAQVEQLVLSFLLAWLARGDDPALVPIVLVVFGIGMGAAINAPTWSAMLPGLVGRKDLAGAISLNSAQMNGSRVIGPAIGGLLFPLMGPAAVFALNGVTYLFVIWALWVIRLPAVKRTALRGGNGLRQLAEGVRYARTDPVVRRALFAIYTFSLISLTFVGQMSTVAEENFGFDPRSLAYGILYAVFGCGALVGSLSLGTVWAARSKAAMVPVSLAAFAIALTPFALLDQPAAAYPLVFVVGFFYFIFITALSTVVQADLDDAVRGRVMALWIMGFGGTVPIGNLLAGPIIEATSMRLVMMVGVAWALFLARSTMKLRALGATA